jgi:hypothetical protein
MSREEAKQIVVSFDGKRALEGLNFLIAKVDKAISTFSNGAFVKLRYPLLFVNYLVAVLPKMLR